MTFRVGQKVVCVDADEADVARPAPIGAMCWGAWPNDLVKGRVYVVRDIGPTADDRPGINVVGLRENCDSRFLARRFRPLIDTTKQVDEMRELIRPIMEGKTVELVK